MVHVMTNLVIFLIKDIYLRGFSHFKNIKYFPFKCDPSWVATPTYCYSLKTIISTRDKTSVTSPTRTFISTLLMKN